MKVKKFGYFFGAGAEVSEMLGLKGSTYTCETFFNKHDLILESLSKLYKSNNRNYTKDFYLKGMVSQLTECLQDIYEQANNPSYPNKECRDVLQSYIEYVKRNFSDDDKVKIEKVYKTRKKEDVFINETIYNSLFKDNVNGDNSLIKEILENSSFSGFVEFYFPYLLEKNSKRKRRLINFYRNCYFAVFSHYKEFARLIEGNNNNSDSPISEKSFVKLLENEGNELFHFLKKHWRNNDVIGNASSYYSDLSKDELLRNASFIATTNYTPIAQNLFCFPDNKMVYLSGKLTSFENIETLEVIDLLDKSVEDNFKLSNYFPYIMSQAKLKPNLGLYTYNVANKFENNLKDVDILIILGYSLCDNDKWIQTFLYDFIVNQKKEIIYCDYLTDIESVDFLKREEDIFNTLLYSCNVQTYKEHIKIIHFTDKECCNVSDAFKGTEEHIFVSSKAELYLLLREVIRN